MGKDNSNPQTQLNFSEQLENFNNCLKTIHEEFNVVHSELSREQKKLELAKEILLWFSNNMTFSENMTCVKRSCCLEKDPIKDLAYNSDKYDKLLKSVSSTSEHPDYEPILKECADDVQKYSNQFLEEVLQELNQRIKNVTFFSLQDVSEVKVYKYLYTPNVRVEPIEFHIGFK